ncbi:hypothetical protein [Pararhizobium sp. A13]|uniref:hypothetical protein n=1 Tax=Pararhizobium sp. A13 TaxID=3133975 RepID=UPI00311B0609
MILKDILTFGTVLYVVLDCFDLRVAIPYRPALDIGSRNIIVNAIAPSEIAKRRHSSGKLVLRPFQ